MKTGIYHVAALQEFARGLKEIIGDSTGLRPFVCDWSPLECKVFVVGYNPTTIIKENFWSFWEPNRGFNKKKWYDAYLCKKEEEYRRKEKKQKQRKKDYCSPTRRVINWVNEAACVPILETNLYARATKDADTLKRLLRGDRECSTLEPFLFLLKSIRPDIIIAHGDDAQRGINQRDIREIIEKIDGGCCVCNVNHFSRGWSEAAAKDLGKFIKSSLRTTC